MEEDGPMAGGERKVHRDYTLRMKDVVRESGVPRQTIHFYLAEGLLPPPLKTGRNTALYSKEHVERLRLIKDLQERQFLPLRAIRAVLQERADPDEFSDEQRSFLEQLRVQLAPDSARESAARVSVREVLGRAGMRRTVADGLAKAGIISIRGRGSGATVSREDAELIRLWGTLEAAGISPERGFAPSDAVIEDRAVRRLVEDEVAIFSEKYVDVEPGEAAEVVRRVIPILNQMIGILHWKRIRAYLEGLGSPDATWPDGNGRRSR